MSAITEEHDKEATVKNKTRQISSTQFDALTNSVHSTLHYADMTGDVALLSSGILSLRPCKSTERVRITPIWKQHHKKADRSG